MYWKKITANTLVDNLPVFLSKYQKPSTEKTFCHLPILPFVWCLEWILTMNRAVLSLGNWSENKVQGHILCHLPRSRGLNSVSSHCYWYSYLNVLWLWLHLGKVNREFLSMVLWFKCDTPPPKVRALEHMFTMVVGVEGVVGPSGVEIFEEVVTKVGPWGFMAWQHFQFSLCFLAMDTMWQAIF